MNSATVRLTSLPASECPVKRSTFSKFASLAATALCTCAAKSGTSATQPLPAPVKPEESILSEYTPEAPPNPNPPPYTLLRFNEDYRYLSDPNNRTDPFDPYKYIPLSPSNPDTYLSLGGALRERYEHFTNPGFGRRHAAGASGLSPPTPHARCRSASQCEYSLLRARHFRPADRRHPRSCADEPGSD